MIEMKKKEIKSMSLTDYLLWSFKERDFTFEGFKKNLEKTKLKAITDVNK
jgi:hypothetical protein